MKKQDYIIASFSGGKDSTAMVLRLIELGERFDEVICCDTYKEFPAMYRHIEKVKKVVEAAGIKFTTLRAEKSFDYYMFDHVPERRRAKSNNARGFAWATARIRWCTGELKKDVIRRYLKELTKTHNVIQCVGIAADEGYRLERAVNKREDMRHPLVEWGWTEEKCLEYCYGKGYDWEGLYEIHRKEKGRCPRVSCWCCPLKTYEDYRILRKHFPDLWQELKEMDKRAWNQFTPRYSVEDFEKRFAFEDERKAAGLSITNREFHKELKKILQGEGSEE